MSSSKNSRQYLYSLLMIIAVQLSCIQLHAGGKKPVLLAGKEIYSSCNHGSRVSDCSICSITASNISNYSYRYSRSSFKENFILTGPSYDQPEEEENPDEEDPIPEEDNPNGFPWAWIVGGTWLLWFIAKGENKS